MMLVNRWSALVSAGGGLKDRTRPSTCKANPHVRIRCHQQHRGGGLTYKDAGVDIDAGAELVRRIAAMTPGIGGFGGLYSVGDDAYEVVGTDGVGTKLKFAFEMNIHDTVGIDLVAMNVNDIITTGATPMYFLDQFSTGHWDMELASTILGGTLGGCNQAGCDYSGGTVVISEGCHPEGILYELSGCAVGELQKGALIDGRTIVAGDVLVGLPSTGLHSNGYSLARRILSMSNLSLEDQLPGAEMTIGEALIVPTKIYVRQVEDIKSKAAVKGMAHITGGGLTENVPRMLPRGLGATIKAGSWHMPRIFKWMKEAGNVEEGEMFRTFNMGIGMVVVLDPLDAERILRECGPAYLIGRVTRGEGVVYERSDTCVAATAKPFNNEKKPENMDTDPRAELVRRLGGKPPRPYPIGDEYSVSRAERVDGKLKLALRMNVHDTIGIDLVAVNVNGIVTFGAKPLSFVDYFSTSLLSVDVAEQVIKGVTRGCREAGCPLTGGETAEMQGFHGEGEYVVNGYALGRVKKGALVDGSNTVVGDLLVGLPSSGVHAHGFSLVHSILEKTKVSLNDPLPGDAGLTIGENLLVPTKIYVKQVLDIISEGGVRGVADIIDGGLTGNIPKVLPPGLGAAVKASSWDVPHVFKWLQEAGEVEEEEMLRTFNMGIGMVLVVEPQAAQRILAKHRPAYLIGSVVRGEGVVYE